MAITDTLDKTRRDLEKTLAEATPLYAVVGAGDLAVEKLRDARADLNARVESVQTDLKAAPEQLRTLPTRAQAAFGDVIANAVSTAAHTYDGLTGRGKTLVTRVRNQEETVALQEQTQTAVSHTKAATTTAKKSAKATKTAAKRSTTTAKKSAKTTTSSVKGTATTAKKSAAKTRTATKSAATSAKKTGTAAQKATEAAAAKVGD